MFSERHVIDCVYVASCVFGGKVSKLLPTLALMELTISRGEVAKGVERGPVSSTLDILLFISKFRCLSIRKR